MGTRSCGATDGAPGPAPMDKGGGLGFAWLGASQGSVCGSVWGQPGVSDSLGSVSLGSVCLWVSLSSPCTQGSAKGWSCIYSITWSLSPCIKPRDMGNKSPPASLGHPSAPEQPLLKDRDPQVPQPWGRGRGGCAGRGEVRARRAGAAPQQLLLGGRGCHEDAEAAAAPLCVCSAQLNSTQLQLSFNPAQPGPTQPNSTQLNPT